VSLVPRTAVRDALSTLTERPLWVWVLTRLGALALGGLAFALTRINVYFDTSYYAGWADGTLTGARVPYRDFAWEYPPGALPGMLLPAFYVPAFPVGHHHAYVRLYGALWVIFMLAVDLALLQFLRRRVTGAPRHPALVVWLYGLPLLGALSWARYDLLPAAAALLALVGAGYGARRSGLAAGVGGTLKLWPLLLAPIQRTRHAAVRASALAASVMATAAITTFLLTGEAGFNQVLRYQNERGLQVESLPALPLIWLAHLHVPGYAVRFDFGSYQVSGPIGAALATTASLLLALGLVLLAAAHWRFMREDAGARLVALTGMSLLMLTILTNKVLSPQYFVWLLAGFAAACVLDPETWRPYIPHLLLATVLTAIVFPWLYRDVIGTDWPGLIVLTIRHLVMLGIAVRIGAECVRQLRAPRKDARLVTST
jgi:hypothetical protein